MDKKTHLRKVERGDKEDYKHIAEKLWSLLDDIDTASDIYKPEMNGFYKYTMKKVAERFKLLESDGYNLTLPKKDHERGHKIAIDMALLPAGER